MLRMTSVRVVEQKAKKSHLDFAVYAVSNFTPTSFSSIFAMQKKMVSLAH